VTGPTLAPAPAAAAAGAAWHRCGLTVKDFPEEPDMSTIDSSAPRHRTMDFLVEFEIKIPEGTPETEVAGVARTLSRPPQPSSWTKDTWSGYGSGALPPVRAGPSGCTAPKVKAS
jgi:hypothetical protein